MGAAVSPLEQATLYLPAPLPHQRPVLESAAKRKLWRAGRRTGKTRAALVAAVDGHGPEHDLKGVLQGGDILWVSPDYPQSNAIWREEILPRFKNLPGVTVSLVDRRVEVAGYGSLELRSAEAIDGVRGRRFDGLIVDEAAHLDLEYAMSAVLLPTLVDRDGWLLVISSPNGGHDGNQAKRVPSYFNMLAEDAERGHRPEWSSWHNRTEDNPTLSRSVIKALRAEYPEGSLTAQQELDALLVAGSGRFYPELVGPGIIDSFVQPMERTGKSWALPDWAEFWGSYDWGYSHPAAFACWARMGNTLYLLDTLYLHRRQDEEQAAEVKGWADPRCLRSVFAGHDAFAKRMAHVAAAETVADVFDRYGVSMGKANIDRAAGAKAVRRLLGKAAPVALVVNDTPGNRRVLEELSRLVPDPLNLDVPAKRDADERGLNGDDGADVFRYGAASGSVEVLEPVRLKGNQNVTDGKDDVDPFEPSVQRVRGITVEYSHRSNGPEGQFGW
jgi:hypothetical protein